MQRESGILLSVSSLPSREGIGTLGEGAYAFIDVIAAAGFRVWQVLPLTPTREGNSPYSSIAAVALNPLFIDLFDLVKQGLLQEDEIVYEKKSRVDYAEVREVKDRLLHLAFSRFDKDDPAFRAFVRDNVYKDYAAFATLLDHFGGRDFRDWEDGYDVYDPVKVDGFLSAHRDEYLYRLFTQFVFLRQWHALKAYANGKGVKILGDMPIYVAMNSAETYMHPELFMLDDARRPAFVAGVPPDYFNADGQMWGNPLYDWTYMRETGYSWWRDRIARELELFDCLRIDHFRGLDRFYAIKADATDAKHGTWMPGPSAELFEGLLDLPIIAEDLGYIDESLRAMLEKVGFPGMKVYEFGLDGDPWNEHKPANYKENVVAYTGTHDNMPLRGYLESLEGDAFSLAARDILVQAVVLDISLEDVLRASALPATWAELALLLTTPYSTDPAVKKPEKQARIDAIERAKVDIFSCLDVAALTRTAVRTLFASKARLAVVPAQDLLGLGADSRMNTPALVGDENWAWRLTREALGALREAADSLVTR